MNVAFDKVAERQDEEFFQVALLALAHKAGGSLSLSRKEILEAYGLVGSVDEINDKFIVKTTKKPDNFNEKQAQAYFDEAKRNAGNWKRP